MGGTQRGQQTDGGLDNVCQRLHLVGLTDTSLKESYLRLFVEQPHRQRHTNLRVITLGRTGHRHRWRQQLVEPLFDHRLTVRAGDADDGDVKFVTMALGQALKSLQW